MANNIIDLNKKRAHRKLADMVGNINQSREMHNKLMAVIDSYIVDGGPSDDAILGMIARAFVYCGHHMDKNNSILKRIVSEEMNEL
jgi:hypothetical protein